MDFSFFFSLSSFKRVLCFEYDTMSDLCVCVGGALESMREFMIFILRYFGLFFFTLNVYSSEREVY